MGRNRTQKAEEADHLSTSGNEQDESKVKLAQKAKQSSGRRRVSFDKLSISRYSPSPDVMEQMVTVNLAPGCRSLDSQVTFPKESTAR